MKTILAVASAGGHWEQMVVLSESFRGSAVTYATTVEGLADRAGLTDATLIRDCNRNQPLDCFVCTWQIFRLIQRVRPDFVVSTGAAPGLIALAIGKLFGAKAVWIDSVANSEQLSLSGKLARRFADLPLAQWKHVADRSGVRYMGGIL